MRKDGYFINKILTVFCRFAEGVIFSQMYTETSAFRSTEPRLKPILLFDLIYLAAISYNNKFTYKNTETNTHTQIK